MIQTQSAAIPFRCDAAGALEVLLVTSRKKRRWVLPKGNAKRGMLAHAAAAMEAFEEAGVIGIVERMPVGSYYQRKFTTNGAFVTRTVRAYPLRVETQLRSWPERSVRDRRWMTVEGAMASVDNDTLRGVLRSFANTYGNQIF
jgi:8-oxo-dGTP pyrophosphatase MutT (NUDIX family)